MACVALDTSFPDSEQAIRLARRLGERHAWSYTVRLWAWGIDQNRENGVLHFDSKRISEIATWRGDADEFVAAMVEVGLLVKLDDGGYYMAGWSRNKPYFTKKNKMMRYRAKKKAATDTALDTATEAAQKPLQEPSLETSRVGVSRSRSRSLSLYIKRNDARARETSQQQDTSTAKDNITAGDIFASMSTWGERWIPAIKSKSDADSLAMKLAQEKPFTVEEVENAKAEAEKMTGNLGFMLLLRKIQFARQKVSSEDAEHKKWATSAGASAWQNGPTFAEDYDPEKEAHEASL